MKLCINNQGTKFQTNVFIFGCAMEEKTGKMMRSLFNELFGITNRRASK